MKCKHIQTCNRNNNKKKKDNNQDNCQITKNENDYLHQNRLECDTADDCNLQPATCNLQLFLVDK